MVDHGEEWPTRLIQPNVVMAAPVKASWAHSEQGGKRQPQFVRASSFGAGFEDIELKILPFFVPTEQQGWRDFEEWAAKDFTVRFSDLDTQESTNFIILPTPGVDWEPLEWQQNRDLVGDKSVYDDLISLAFIPPPPPAPKEGWDDWDWNKNFDAYSVWAAMEHEDWPNTLSNTVAATTANFFDEFEEQWNSKATFNQYSPQTLEEDWISTGFAASAPVPFYCWDDLDWHKRFEQIYAPQTVEEDVAFPVVIPLLAWDEIDWQRYWSVQLSLPTDEEPSIVQNEPPSIAQYPVFDDWDWSQRFMEARMLQFTYGEEEPFAFTIFPAQVSSGTTSTGGHIYGTQTFQKHMQHICWIGFVLAAEFFKQYKG